MYAGKINELYEKSANNNFTDTCKRDLNKIKKECVAYTHC